MVTEAAVERIVEAALTDAHNHFQEELGFSMTAEEVDALRDAIEPIILRACIDGREESDDDDDEDRPRLG